MRKKKWSIKKKIYSRINRQRYDYFLPVYALEEYYIKENQIYLQLSDVNRYLSFFSEKYLYFLENYDGKKISPEMENLVLNSFIEEEKIQDVWVEKVIDESEYAVRLLNQCQFICFDPNNHNQMINGYNHPNAKLYRCDSSLTSYVLSYKSALHKNVINSSLEYSAHVDVGQGCCSFVFDKKNLIGIDCSNRELSYLKNPQSYQLNIDKCLDYISKYQSNKKGKLVINAFILTHAHQDHFSGIFNLVKNGYINSTTDFFVNVVFVSQNGFYKNLMKYLLQKNVNIVHAIPQNSAGNISFLYPLLGTVNNKKKPNEVSVITSIRCPSGDFIFPGDMVAQGWSKQLPTTSSIVQNAKFFAVSHHGSITGYNGNFFPNAPLRTIIMVRNNAYDNVPDPTVFDATFNAQKNIISTNDLKSTKSSFYLIDLTTGIPSSI